MAFKYYKACKVCNMMRGNPKLVKRVQNSRAYVKNGESLVSIAKDLNIRYAGLHNHCQRHQGISEEDRAARELNDMARRQQIKQVREVVKHGDVRQLILDEGADQIKDGRVKLTASAIVAASKQASDIEEKHLDRQLEILKMVNAFASGEIINKGNGQDGIDPGSTPNSYIEG